jgi:predicted nucleic acid-binding protein
MKAWVVDASVVAAAFFPERLSKDARTLLRSNAVLHAPDLVYAEVANVLWKRCRRSEITCDEASAMLADVLNLPLIITPSDQVVHLALELSLRTNRTVYDCLYIALAMQLKTAMLSGDQRLVNALAAGPLKDCVAWLGAIP